MPAATAPGRRRRSRPLAALVLAAVAPAPAAADPVADFYRGRNMEIIITTSPGGEYDLRARLIARHMPRHIPGSPTIIPRNMPGAAGLAAANYVMKIAPRDGTVLHAASQSLALSQALGQKGLEVDVRQLLWIGNTTDTPNVIGAWHTTGFTRIEQVRERELPFASTGAGSSTFIYPSVLNAVIGTRFKIVTGYPGGPEMDLAMEKGEVGARTNVWTSWKRGHPDWIAQKKVSFLVQVTPRRHPDLPDVPTMAELGQTPQDRELLALLSADTAIARAVAGTPGIPAERAAALRKAFDAVARDPEFIAEAAKIGLELSIADGAETERVVRSIVDAPPALLARLKALVGF